MTERRNPIAPVFVVGMPRSGTTWVSHILSWPAAVGRIDESYMLSRAGGLGALFSRLGARPDAKAPPAGLGRLMSRAELVEDVRSVAERWLARAAPEGEGVVVEKSPWHLRDAKLIAEVLPHARIVHVLRDGRDVAVSLLAGRRTWGRTDDPRAVRTVAGAAELWTEAVSLAREAQEGLGGCFLGTRFEELKLEPEAGVRRLLSFAGIEHDDALVERIARETAFEAMHAGGEDRFYRGGRVGDWRSRFTLGDARAFDRVAGNSLAETGYEDDPRWWLRQPLLRSRLAKRLPGAPSRVTP